MIADVLTLCMGVLVAGQEYRRRERLHRERMSFLTAGEEPPEPSRTAPLLTVILRGVVFLVSIGGIVTVIVLAAGSRPPYTREFLIVLLPLVILSVFLGVGFMSDIRDRRSNSTAGKE